MRNLGSARQKACPQSIHFKELILVWFHWTSHAKKSARRKIEKRRLLNED